METKLCSRCQETKTLDQFYKLNENMAKKHCQSDGVDYYCKYCRTGQSIKSHRGGNKKPCSVEGCQKTHYAKSYCRMHYARVVRTGKIEGNHSGNPNDKRDYHLRLHYLITLDEFNKRSENGCEICGDKPEKTLHVDHDHNCCNQPITCGKCVRGVICGKCNLAVDKYEKELIRADYPDLDKITEYVRKYNAK